VCRQYNREVDEVRDDVQYKRVTLDEVVATIKAEAELKQDQVKELRELDPPAEAGAYLDRLERNAAGFAQAAESVAEGGGRSYEDFLGRMFNSENVARKEAEALGLEHCSPAPLN
jgi:hypothetical protein